MDTTILGLLYFRGPTPIGVPSCFLSHLFPPWVQHSSLPRFLYSRCPILLLIAPCFLILRALFVLLLLQLREYMLSWSLSSSCSCFIMSGSFAVSVEVILLIVLLVLLLSGVVVVFVFCIALASVVELVVVLSELVFVYVWQLS